MKKIVLLAAALCLSLPFASAQDSNRFSIKFYGFVRNYLNYDSRKTYTVVGQTSTMSPRSNCRR